MLRAVKQKALSVALADSLQGSPRDHAASLSGKSLLSTPGRAKLGQALPGITTVSWLNFQAFLSPLPLFFWPLLWLPGPQPLSSAGLNHSLKPLGSRFLPFSLISSSFFPHSFPSPAFHLPPPTPLSVSLSPLFSPFHLSPQWTSCPFFPSLSHHHDSSHSPG